MYIHILTHTHLNVYIYVSMKMHIRKYAHMYICMHVYICTHLWSEIDLLMALPTRNFEAISESTSRCHGPVHVVSFNFVCTRD